MISTLLGILTVLRRILPGTEYVVNSLDWSRHQDLNTISNSEVK